MSQGKKPQSRGWLKNVLRFIAILLFLFLALNCICCYDSIVHRSNLIYNKCQKNVGKRKYERSF